MTTPWAPDWSDKGRKFSMKLTKTKLKQIIKEELEKVAEAQGLEHQAGKVTGQARTLFNSQIVQKIVGQLRASLEAFQDELPRKQFVALLLGDEGLGVSEKELADLSMLVGRKTVEEEPTAGQPEARALPGAGFGEEPGRF